MLADLQYLTEEELLDVTIVLDRNLATPVVSSDGTAFDYSAEQKVKRASACNYYPDHFVVTVYADRIVYCDVIGPGLSWPHSLVERTSRV